MGDPNATNTKLTDWGQFDVSIMDQRTKLEPFRSFRMLGVSEREYSEALVGLKPHCRAFMLSVSAATVVVNSKALFHIFPEFIPPLDVNTPFAFSNSRQGAGATPRGSFGW
jgi:hypothetical protein